MQIPRWCNLQEAILTKPTPAKRRKSRRTKDRVLQARIPRDLDDELRDHAEQLGLSVSTVVRNVLLNTFQLVEGVVADSSQLARVLQGKPSRALHRPDSDTGAPDEPVVGWQEAIGCGGVAVIPNDVVVADADGAVLIPAALLDQVIAEAPEQERLEGWIMSQIAAGVPLPGLYRPLYRVLNCRHQCSGGCADHQYPVNSLQRPQQLVFFGHDKITIAEGGEIHHRVIESIANHPRLSLRRGCHGIDPVGGGEFLHAAETQRA